MAQNLLNNCDVPLGVRVEFFYQWSQWIQTIDQRVQLTSKVNQNPQSNQINTLKNDTSNAQKLITAKINVPSNQTSINLLEILQSNSDGKGVMKILTNPDGSAVERPQLTENLRKLLLEAILQFYIANKRSLNKDDCNSLTNQICKTFPDELAVHHQFSFI